MKQDQTNRPRFNRVSAFIAMLGIQSMMEKKDPSLLDDGQDLKEFSYAGLGKFQGSPIYSPRRGKIKGYMKNKTSFNKRR